MESPDRVGLHYYQCFIPRTFAGVECYCDAFPNTPSHCFDSSEVNGMRSNSCVDPDSICYTSHFATGPNVFGVIAGCLQKEGNPWPVQCDGTLNSPTLVFQCCDTPMCNEEFFNGPSPFITPSTPGGNSTVTTESDDLSGSGIRPDSTGTTEVTEATTSTATPEVTPSLSPTSDTNNGKPAKQMLIILLSILYLP